MRVIVSSNPVSLVSPSAKSNKPEAS